MPYRVQFLSEDFIREFKDRVDWTSVSARQILSEDFIREFIYMVNWYLIPSCQEVSDEFIREFKDRKIFDERVGRIDTR